MKKLLKILCLLIVFLFVFCPQTAFADEKQQIEQEIEQNLQIQLDKIDFSAGESIVDELTMQEKQLFGADSFFDKIKRVLNGDFANDSDNFLNAFFKLLFDNVLQLLPVLVSIAVVAVLCGIVSNAKSGFMTDSTANMVFLVCFAIVIVLVLTSTTKLLDITKSVINGMKNQMNFAFPVLLTLMAAIGGTVSVRAYQPAVALLSGGVVEVVSNVVLPLFIFSFVLTLLGLLFLLLAPAMIPQHDDYYAP